MKMVQYIDKDALVAKIKDLKLKLNWTIVDFSAAKEIAYDNVLDAISGLEVKEVDIEQFNKLLNWWKEVTTEHSVYKVKEVDLEKELSMLDRTLFDLDGVAVKGATHYLTVEDVKDIAKHFFELGLKMNQKDLTV